MMCDAVTNAPIVSAVELTNTPHSSGEYQRLASSLFLAMLMQLPFTNGTLGYDLLLNGYSASPIFRSVQARVLIRTRKMEEGILRSCCYFFLVRTNVDPTATRPYRPG